MAGRFARHVTTISIHSPRMRGDAISQDQYKPAAGISIHSPRMRGDLLEPVRAFIRVVISIHSPRMRGDEWDKVGCWKQKTFQSTPLA